MADLLLCTRIDVFDLSLDTFRVCTGQDNHYLIEVESTGLAPVFQLISEQLISPKLFMGVLFEHSALLLYSNCVCVFIRIVYLIVNIYRLVYSVFA